MSLSASLEGQTLDKYHVLEALGRGGMARVYRAYHPHLDRYVAIKVMRSDLVDDPAFLARFRREAQAVAGLRHTNIVQVFDFDVQDDIYYMVMELLEGDTLKTRLNDYRARGERMPWGEMVRVLLDVLGGLAYAHGEGMVHRDIKPANIMLTKRGQAVISDFGIAQIIGGTRHTVSGALMGTLSYMAPEQGLEGHCNARSDLYSLGIVLYEMLTDTVPFDADTPLAILMKHLNDPLPLPRQLDPNIPEPFERILLKALAKQPEDRYQNAEEMAQVLSEAATAADIRVPSRISLPLSFTTAETPSESVAVLSGTARQRITDPQFAHEETDTTLGQRLAAEAASQGSERTTRRVKRARPSRAPSPDARPSPARFTRSALTAIGSLVTVVSSGASRAAPYVTDFLTAERPGRLVRAILSAVGLAAAYNILAIWIGGLTGWWGLFGTGWPIEFFVATLGLCVIMYAVSEVWLAIPAGILFGNGVLFSYYAITGKWWHWAFLWPLEPVLIGGTIWFTVRLARRANASQQWGRPLGCALGVTAIAWSAMVVLAAIVGSILA